VVTIAKITFTARFSSNGTQLSCFPTTHFTLRVALLFAGSFSACTVACDSWPYRLRACLSPSSAFHFLPALHLPNELMRFRRAHIAIEFRPPQCHHFQPESPPTTPLVRAPPFRTLLHCNFTNLYDSVYASCPIGTSTNLASNLFVPFCTRSNNVAAAPCVLLHYRYVPCSQPYTD
jgi:hypothetical protein